MNIDDIELKHLRHFLMLVRAGSLSRASRDNAVAKGSLSASLKRLESQMGLALMERLQTGLELTEAGHALAERAPAIFDAHEVAIGAARRAHSEMEGSVKIVAAHEFGASILGQAAMALAQRAPGLEFDLEFYPADIMFRRLVDFDCMIYFGEPPATWLVARKIADVHYGVYGAPKMAAQHEQASDCDDLAGITGVDLRRDGLSEPWHLENDGQLETIDFHGRFRVHDYWMARYIAQSGQAAAYLPSFFIRDALNDGLLKPILPEWESPRQSVHLLYPQTRKANPRVRMVVEALEQALRSMLI